MNLTLLTDFYELSMMQGYFLHKENPRVVFDMFFRRQPFGGGFSVFAGLETALDQIGSLAFSQDDLAYLEGLGVFRKEFLDYLADFRFRGDIWAMDEGTLAFPGEPLVRVHASLMEAQLIESALLAILNFQTLIATKAARIRLAANGGAVIEFGLRRAQGVDGALSASRAAFIGGAAPPPTRWRASSSASRCGGPWRIRGSWRSPASARRSRSTPRPTLTGPCC